MRSSLSGTALNGAMRQTVKTVFEFQGPSVTRLKPGENENSKQQTAGKEFSTPTDLFAAYCLLPSVSCRLFAVCCLLFAIQY